MKKIVIQHSPSNLPTFILGGNFNKEKRMATLTLTPFPPKDCKIGDEVFTFEDSIVDIRFFNTQSIDVWINQLQGLKRMIIENK